MVAEQRELHWDIGPFTVMQRREGLYLYFQLLSDSSRTLGSDRRYIACMTSIRRFIARCGQPRFLPSDNKSNFLGAIKQIRRQNLQLDHDFIKDNLLNKSVEWRLNPPFCSSLWGHVGEDRTDCKSSSSFESGFCQIDLGRLHNHCQVSRMLS